MTNKFTIGIIIADNDEYAPIENYSAVGKESKNLKFMDGHIIPFGNAVLRTVLCGIGKVNAAVAATMLIAEGVDIVVNFGLSGGIDGVSRGDTIIASRFLEHDFNLTALGYAVGEKPGQKYIYDADQRLVRHFRNTYKGIKTGTVVTGDSFVSDPVARDMLKNTFGAIACDMETAAIAYCCNAMEVPFVSVRRISDDAGDTATDDYRDMNNLADSSLMQIVFDALKSLNYAEF